MKIHTSEYGQQKIVYSLSPAKAVPILEELGKMDGVIALSANTTLEEWRAGRLFLIRLAHYLQNVQTS